MIANCSVSAMLRASDLDRAKAFYTETLGLPLIAERGVAFVVETQDGSQIAVYQRENMPVPQNNVALWQVDDIDSVAFDLIERGIEPQRYAIPDVEFDENGVTTLAGLRTLWFLDSEDNIHMVAEPFA